MTNSLSNEKIMPRPSRVGRITLLVAKMAVALIFVATGTSKILGVQQLVDGFVQIGLGQWFRYFTGAIEICGALLLLWPLSSGLGALILLCVSVSAFFVQLFIMHGDVVHTLVLATLSGWLAWTARDALQAHHFRRGESS